MIASRTESGPMHMETDTIMSAARGACARVAPVWPLDQFIAVNPWWPLTGEAPDKVAADLAARSGANLLMPRSYFKQLWDRGVISASHLAAAAAERSVAIPVAELVSRLDHEPSLAQVQLMTHVLDAHRDLERHMAWQDEVTHEISQLCAAFFDLGQAAWHLDTSKGLYASWMQAAAHERGIGLVMGVKGLNHEFAALPGTPEELIAVAVNELEIEPRDLEDYLHALLLSINGWASWCAYRKWQAGLAGQEDETIVQLLAIRLAWELVLYRGGDVTDRVTHWSHAKARWSGMAARNFSERTCDWVWQRAMELSYQTGLAAKLAAAVPATSSVRPAVQAAFCIDVRSEVFRRALESVSGQVQTLGFAGFFGMPIAYRQSGTELQRPQLPGLLAPKYLVEDTCGCADASDDHANRRKQQLAANDAWRGMRTAGPAGFSYVESAGLLYAWKLVKDGLTKSTGPRNKDAGLKPRLVSGVADGQPVDLPSKISLAAGVLKAMTLASGMAPLVLLIGHGSRSQNNPHAAGLDCGACCGQTGEVNARALAALLNDPLVRSGLADKDIRVPEDTVFVPALHNTTTDEVELFDLDDVPATHAGRIREVQSWLAEAGVLARKERAPLLGESLRSDADGIAKAITARSFDWSQVRPEWGLANNAAFIVGPRSLTRGINLGGRTFLHDYNWRSDEGFKILELIMTAPMVVTHWINMQYYASTVDNVRYGSGNKVLHNVVGGSIGVFEGNGGDLRIGLSMQSLHNGENWMHQPLRISVVIDAPAAAMADIVSRHAKVRELVDNEWLYLFRFDAEDRTLSRYCRGVWSSLAADAGTRA